MSVRFLLISTAIALAPQVCRAEAMRLAGDGLDLAVNMTATAPDAPVVGGLADLNAKVLSFQTSLKVEVQTGSTKLVQDDWSPFAASARAGSWTTGKVGLVSLWEPTDRAKLQLSADGQTRSELDPADPIWNGSTDRYVRSSQTTARAAATLAPAAPLIVDFGAEASARSLRSASLTDGTAAGADLLTTGSRQAFTNVQWRLLPQISLEGGGKAEAIDVAWAGAGERGGTYGFLEPRAAAVLKPWEGATWRFGVERAVSPVREDQFLAFAQTADQGANAAFEPDREWRYQATLNQALPGDLALTATLTRARLQSVTDLGPVGLGQAPVDIGGGERRQVEASLAAPAVALFGLPPLAVKLRGTLRDSQVSDPFTGAFRRLSGEAPYEAELTISPSAVDAQLHWGVSAHAVGGAANWQMDQVATRSATAGLSGFVAYKPGPLAVRLQLDNLVGGGRAERDTFFVGPRLFNTIERMSETRGGDRAVRITLSRSL